LTSKIHALVDTNGLPVQLAPTGGEAHDNRLAGKLLSRLKPATMLLADRGYDADWIRTLAADRGAWANIPPRSNRNNPICAARISIVPATGSRVSSTRSNSVGGSLLVTTSLRPTISPSSSWHQYGYGYVLMSPRPNLYLPTSAFRANETADARDMNHRQFIGHPQFIEGESPPMSANEPGAAINPN
jgi:transposase